MTPSTVRARVSSRLVLAAVALLSLAVCALVVATLVIMGAPDPCGPAEPVGEEVRARRMLVLGSLASFVIGALIAIVGVLVATGRRVLAAVVIGCACGFAVGGLLAGEVNAARSAEATPERCRELSNLPPPDITGTAYVDVTIEDRPLRGLAAGQASCLLTPDGAATKWLSTGDGREWDIGDWYLFELHLLPRGSGNLPSPLWEERPEAAPSPILELEEAEFWLLIYFGQPGSSAAYGALGGEQWRLADDLAQPARQITFDLPQLPELGGNTPADAPESIRGTLAWRCVPGEYVE